MSLDLAARRAPFIAVPGMARTPRVSPECDSELALHGAAYYAEAYAAVQAYADSDALFMQAFCVWFETRVGNWIIASRLADGSEIFKVRRCEELDPPPTPRPHGRRRRVRTVIRTEAVASRHLHITRPPRAIVLAIANMLIEARGGLLNRVTADHLAVSVGSLIIDLQHEIRGSDTRRHPMIARSNLFGQVDQLLSDAALVRHIDQETSHIDILSIHNCDNDNVVSALVVLSQDGPGIALRFTLAREVLRLDVTSLSAAHIEQEPVYLLSRLGGLRAGCIASLLAGDQDQGEVTPLHRGRRVYLTTWFQDERLNDLI